MIYKIVNYIVIGILLAVFMFLFLPREHTYTPNPEAVAIYNEIEKVHEKAVSDLLYCLQFTPKGSGLTDKTMDCMEKLNDIELNRLIDRLGEIE